MSESSGPNFTSIKNSTASDPENFICFFEKAANDSKLKKHYCPPIIEGIAANILYQTCHITSFENWTAKNPLPDIVSLASFILKSLENHPFLWNYPITISEGLKACACAVKEKKHADSLIFYFLRLSTHRNPEPFKPSLKSKKNINLNDTAQNSVRGKIAEASILLALNQLKQKLPFHQLLESLLFRFATDTHIGVRISILKHLADYAQHAPHQAWKLFQTAMPQPHPLLWSWAEFFLQAQYDKNFQNVKYYLNQAKQQHINFNDKSWAKILVLAYMAGNISEKFLSKGFSILNSHNARSHAFELLTNDIINNKNSIHGLKGLLSIMPDIKFTSQILNQIQDVFKYLNADSIDITFQIVYKFIDVFKGSDDDYSLVWFYLWLDKSAKKMPIAVIQVCENLLSKIEKSEIQYYIWQTDKFSDKIIQILQNIKSTSQQSLISRFILLKNREQLKRNV